MRAQSSSYFGIIPRKFQACKNGMLEDKTLPCSLDANAYDGCGSGPLSLADLRNCIAWLTVAQLNLWKLHLHRSTLQCENERGILKIQTSSCREHLNNSTDWTYWNESIASFTHFNWIWLCISFVSIYEESRGTNLCFSSASFWRNQNILFLLKEHDYLLFYKISCPLTSLAFWLSIKILKAR